jgi:hypothetical protein
MTADPEAETPGATWEPRDSEWVDPPLCSQGGCQAVAAKAELCLRHLTGPDRAAAITQTLEPELVDLRGLDVDPELWADLIDPLKAVAFDAAAAKTIWLQGARFGVPAYFYGWRFTGNVSFDASKFESGANFYGAVFEKDVSFATAVFGRNPEDEISADFQDAVFHGSVDLNGTEFQEEARFYRARFEASVDLQGTEFRELASFQETDWLTPQRLFGPIKLTGELNFRRAAFEGDLLLEVEGGELNFVDTRFGGSLALRSRSSALVLEHINLTHPALIALAADSTVDEHGSPLVTTAIDFSSTPEGTALPRIRSLRDSNVLALTIASADLGGCLFQGTRNVDRLSVEGQTPFASTPKQRSRRRVIHEEIIWRLRRAETATNAIERIVAQRAAPHWEAVQPTDRWGSKDSDPTPEQLARIYRGLRKSLEESKDYAGASDLYYGEMEMRRRAPSTPRADRMIIGLYWAMSGYGLRASRSLVALGLVLAIAAAIFAAGGFVANDSYLDGLLHSARAAALFPQADDIELTQGGQILQIALRVLGPVLIGLTALALRARIKR